MNRAFVTGASRGLGSEFTRQLLARGTYVFAGARSPEDAIELDTLKEEYGQQLCILQLDVTDLDQINQAVAAVRKKAEGIDLLINNAGVNSHSKDVTIPDRHLKLGSLDPTAILEMCRVNAVSPLMMVQRFLDPLRHGDHARVISLSSWLGSLATKTTGGNYSYCGSKALLNMLMRIAAFDLIDSGIVSVIMNPGWVATDMGGAHAHLTPRESVEHMLRIIEGLTEEDAGKFLNWDGEELPW